MNWYLGCWKKYAEFGGRARRTEFWMFALINFIVSLGIGFVEGMLGMGGMLAGLYSLAVMLPSLAVSVRRLHDVDRCGWWLLIALVPLLGIILLIFFCIDSKPGENRFGPNPKGL